VTAAVARSTIAHRILGPPARDTQFGGIVLHAHQRDATGVLRRLLDDERGALLADDVGLGKTFTALALARGCRTLVIVPAALRDAWTDSARRMDVPVALATFESLSRGAIPAASPELVVIDEAHHLRNPATRRFAAARAICRDARVLMLTATPVQNAERDLRVLLSLFLGERAHALPGADLARYIIRRTSASIGAAGPSLPEVGEPQWLEPIDDTDCLDRILALPPPVPPRDAGTAGVLAGYSLVRQWASSRAALLAALGRRLARGMALVDALREGVWPSRSELSAWVYEDGDQQLALPGLVVHGAGQGEVRELLSQVEAHLAGLRELLARLRATPDPDDDRAARLRTLLRSHPGLRLVAFSEYAETVSSLFTRMTREARTAMLTHTGGRVAGGPISRREIIARFSPAAIVPEAERIDLLLTTDVLSEGVGLHAASIVAHLDLAWNPARLAQRVGRVRRLGATSRHVHVFLMPPPAPAERLLQLESRLRAKMDDAARTVGVAGMIVPGMSHASDSLSDARRRLVASLATWQVTDAAQDAVISAVHGSRLCALVCAGDGARARLLAWDGRGFSDGTDEIERVVGSAIGPPADVPLALGATVAREAAAWLDRHRLGASVDLTAMRVARSRRSVLHRADGIARRLPRHARVRVASLVSAARAAATATLSAGAERVLDELAHAPMPDEAWLQAVGQFARLHARPDHGTSRVDVVLLVTPARAGSD
jgi:superfamily II DNA or RNA helicase